MVRLYLRSLLFTLLSASTATATLSPMSPPSDASTDISFSKTPYNTDFLVMLQKKPQSHNKAKLLLAKSFGDTDSPENSFLKQSITKDDLLLNPYHFHQAFGNTELINLQTDKAPSSIFQDNTPIDPPTFLSSQSLLDTDDLDASPYYISSGQDAIPFGRASNTAMITAPLITSLATTSSMPIILGFQSPQSGPFLALYGFRSNITGKFDIVPGIDAGYLFKRDNLSAEIGLSYTPSLGDAAGLQDTGAGASEAFGGFNSMSHGTQEIQTVPAVDFHGNITMGHYKLLAEWLIAARAFQADDLSFDGRGARPQAGHLEAGVNFNTLDKDAGVALGYQWSQDTLALGIPNHRISAIFDIEWWQNTRQRLEYRHDIDFSTRHYGNGAAPEGETNQTSRGTGKASDAIIAQISVFF